MSWEFFPWSFTRGRRYLPSGLAPMQREIPPTGEIPTGEASCAAETKERTGAVREREEKPEI